MDFRILGWLGGKREGTIRGSFLTSGIISRWYSLASGNISIYFNEWYKQMVSFCFLLQNELVLYCGFSHLYPCRSAGPSLPAGVSLIFLDQSEVSIQVTWSFSANQRPAGVITVPQYLAFDVIWSAELWPSPDWQQQEILSQTQLRSGDTFLLNLQLASANTSESNSFAKELLRISYGFLWLFLIAFECLWWILAASNLFRLLWLKCPKMKKNWPGLWLGPWAWVTSKFALISTSLD